MSFNFCQFANSITSVFSFTSFNELLICSNPMWSSISSSVIFCIVASFLPHIVDKTECFPLYCIYTSIGRILTVSSITVQKNAFEENFMDQILFQFVFWCLQKGGYLFPILPKFCNTHFLLIDVFKFLLLLWSATPTNRWIHLLKSAQHVSAFDNSYYLWQIPIYRGARAKQNI